MRRLFLFFTLFLVLACQGSRVAITSAPTGSQANQTPELIGQAPEATGVGTSAPVAIVPVPVSAIQIEGVPYTAYQIPGDSFRFVCQEPCPLDPQYIFAEYAGFRIAHTELIKLTGVDTLTELQPVDMHLVFEDSICREFPGGACLHIFRHAPSIHLHRWTRILPNDRGEDSDSGPARRTIFPSSRIHAHDFLWENLREGGEFRGS